MDRRTLAEEVLVVLVLSLLASAVYAILDLFEAPLRGVTVASVNQSNELLRQIVGVVFGLGPVYLVLHLVRRSGEGTGAIGLGWDRPLQDMVRGAFLFAVVGSVGVGVYLGAVALGVNRFVVPAPPLGHWWTVPLLLLNAAEAALLEEVIVVGYLITRLRQIGWGGAAAILGSGLLRAGYHLYQGWGGFAGNLAMGLFFGWLFVRTRRVWPLVVAHLLLDAGAGLGYVFFRSHLPGFS
ncbi:MAG: CPBP family intramembrane metalloprotease [Actinobacteria bacterium]|nr:CPBP family intramembrane metalloprotease [Actinomycetota bacterium]